MNEKRGHLVLSRVSDASFGPFTEDEARAFAARDEAYWYTTVAALSKDMYSCLKYGLEFKP